MALNYIDLLLVIVVLFGALGGWRWGFVLASLHLATLAASLVIAFIGYPLVDALLGRHFPQLGVWAAPLAFLGVFALAHVLIGAVANGLARVLPRAAHGHAVNRTLGLAPGIVQGLVNASIVAILALVIPGWTAVQHEAQESQLARTLAEPAQWAEAQLAPIFDPAVRHAMRAITVPPDSRETKQLRFKTTQAKPRPDLEDRMLDLVNAERAKQNLKPLKADPEVVALAREHSLDMLARGYFSHVSPEGDDLAARLRKKKHVYLVAGENLALAPSLAMAHEGLMNSPGHRANILRPQFGRLAIGVLDAGPYGLMVTQAFRN